LIIRSIEFIISAAKIDQFIQDGLPQIVLSGRSNVGKSSFINAMLNHSKIAKVSQTPGKTRLINYFLINKKFYFVDIPGYGFAKVSQDMLETFRQRIEDYLETSRDIYLAVLLLDIRHLPTNDDLLMKAYFESQGLNVLYVLTKSDKLSNNQRLKQKKAIQEKLGLEKTDSLVFFSAETKENRELIWDMIEGYITEGRK